MKIVGITSCTCGIAHTYMAREKLLETGKKLGWSVKIETQGSGGIEFALTDQDIQEADCVLLATDVAVSGTERFKGKPVVKVPVSTAIKSPEHLLKKIEEKAGLCIYNLGTGHGYSVLDIVKNFEAANDIKIPYVIKDRRPGDIATCYCNPGKAERELGWKAQYGIKEMCADSWRWQKNNPNGYED